MRNYFAITSLLLILQNCEADLLVFTQETNTIIEEFPDAPARFGPGISPIGLKCVTIAGDPEDGCSTLKYPPKANVSFGWCVIVARYNCSFEKKIRNAQAADYDAVIVHNINSDELEPMSANDDAGIKIPSVFVGAHTGQLLIQAYQYTEKFAVLINNDSEFNINTHLLLPFTIVVGLCFITMIIFSIGRCYRERRRMMRYRLPKSALKKIPIIKFNQEIHHYDVCAICLEDFVDSEKLRVLPCVHAYHCKCIDPWLTKNRRVCPMCKRKVFIRGEKVTTRARLISDISASSDDDNTPLLIASNTQQVDHGTFNQQVNADTNDNMMANIENNLTQAGISNASDDEEILDGTTSTSQISERRSIWQKLKRFIIPGRIDSRGMSNDIISTRENVSGTLNQNIQMPSTSINIHQMASSNNILNSNLSGSFNANYIGAADEENILTSQNSIDAVPHSLLATLEVVPSSSGRIGVAAIPNTRYNKQSRRCDSNNVKT